MAKVQLFLHPMYLAANGMMLTAQTIADTILDRIIHDAHCLEMKVESMRTTQNRVEEN